MVASIWARIILFLSSYSPLLVILGLLNSENWMLSAVLYAIAAASLVVLYLFLASHKGEDTDQVAVKKVASKDSEALSYIVTYLLPFLGISIKELVTAISLAIFIAVIGIIYVSSNIVYINPILSLRGYHMLEIEDGSGKVSMLVTKRPYVRPGSTIEVWSLSDFAFLQKVK